MKEFLRTVEVMDALLAPGGCPWDQKQTFESMRTCLLEEVHEAIDAVNKGDIANLREEVGDVLWAALFYCKLGEKFDTFTTEEVLQEVVEKIVRRHPHVFGDSEAETESEVMDQWEAIKAAEKGEVVKSPFDSIPQGLPALSRAAETLSKLESDPHIPPSDPELVVAQGLWSLVQAAREHGVDPEQALLRFCTLKQEAGGGQ